MVFILARCRNRFKNLSGGAERYFQPDCLNKKCHVEYKHHEPELLRQLPSLAVHGRNDKDQHAEEDAQRYRYIATLDQDILLVNGIEDQPGDGEPNEDVEYVTSDG